MQEIQNNSIQIFQLPNGELHVNIDHQKDTVWLSQSQIAELYNKDRTVVTKHINSIFNTLEVDKNSNVQKMHFANSDKPISLYSLDVILAVGYRTNSKNAILFRQWASSILKDYLQKGYILNQKLLEDKQSQITEIQQTLDFLINNKKNLEAFNPFLDILQKYTSTLITLNQYDEGRIINNKSIEGVAVDIKEFKELIEKTKLKLNQINEASELFGKEIDNKFESTISAVYQSFGGLDLYPNLAEKSANLLYLVIKNHSFVDGNKRIGSILFVYFLAKNNFLYKNNSEIKINNNTLVTLALLIAQSNPKDKDILVKLIIRLIQN